MIAGAVPVENMATAGTRRCLRGFNIARSRAERMVVFFMIDSGGSIHL